ncbi:MAG: glycoside hydrolase family 127 protein [Planctomycetota bacterium]
MRKSDWSDWCAVLMLLFVPVAVADEPDSMSPVNFSDVTINSEFWSPRQETNRRVSIPHNLETCEETGRIDNFRHASGAEPRDEFRGHIFHDSDVYKVLEGVAYSLHTHPDPELKARLDEIIDLIAGSQHEDGYLNTWFTVAKPEDRWTNLAHDHELYCAGHMFEAAVAHYRATGDREFLDVACRFADYIDSVFGEGKRHGIAGHPEIELALVKLWRATGEERYLNLARFFVEEHGNDEHRKLFGRYAQDHLPVREQTEPVGHAVRFLYFYSGVADLAAIDGEEGYMKTMGRLWDYIVNKKMYITGGVGVQGHGEGFANAYYLPNHQAYCETCASIGMVFWNHRLALLHGDGKYADLVERLLYNGAISGVSLDGSKFFYVNPLASRGNHHRQPWYGCACCPTNVVRFVASLGQYPYATLGHGEGICVLQYVEGEVDVELESGEVRLWQKTNYPWEGNITIGVEPKRPGEFTIRLRIPAWCEDATMSVNGERVEVAPEQGFVSIRRTWRSGDSMHLNLPMKVRHIAPNPKVESQRGRMAVMRGPVVYCLEDADNPCPVGQVAIPADAQFETEFRDELLGGVSVLKTRGARHGVTETKAGLDVVEEDVELTMIPYHVWDNREPGAMVVWVPTEVPEVVDPENATIAVVAETSASHCHSADTTMAVNDNVVPDDSSDHSIPRMTWWSHRGSEEWVSLEFDKPHTFSKAEVYWFDDSGRGSCRVPASWRLLYKDGNQWRPVKSPSAYGVAKDQFNAVTFDPVTTHALRVEAQLQPKFSGGVLEWRLPE